MADSYRKSVLIFGATGNAGKYAARHALNAQDDVSVFVRSPGKLPLEIRERVQTIVGDITDPVAVTEAVKKVCKLPAAKDA